MGPQLGDASMTTVSRKPVLNIARRATRLIVGLFIVGLMVNDARAVETIAREAILKDFTTGKFFAVP